MMVIVESKSAGLSISLINKHIRNHKMIDQCMQAREDHYTYEVSSVVVGVSDSSCVHHVHM